MWCVHVWNYGREISFIEGSKQKEYLNRKLFIFYAKCFFSIKGACTAKINTLTNINLKDQNNGKNVDKKSCRILFAQNIDLDAEFYIIQLNLWNVLHYESKLGSLWIVSGFRKKDAPFVLFLFVHSFWLFWQKVKIHEHTYTKLWASAKFGLVLWSNFNLDHYKSFWHEW